VNLLLQKKPTGKHLAPKPAFAPLTEIAQVVASNDMQRRAAVVATAGGLFMSTFAAANLDLEGFGESDEVYAESVDGIVPSDNAELADGEAATDGEADEVIDGTELPDDATSETGSETVTDDEDAIDDDFIAAFPEWVVEAAAVETPEAVTETGFAVVSATPAPPPAPARRVAGVGRSTATVAPPASVAGNAILEIAARYVGVPYVWGGGTPAGFDCSGFTSYVFGQAGINLPRTSRAQAAAGTVVSREDAQPGDLVWWPGHVGIFVEGNTFIDVAGPGRGVAFRNMWHRNPTFIRL